MSFEQRLFEWTSFDTVRLNEFRFLGCKTKIQMGNHPPGKLIQLITVDFDESLICLHINADSIPERHSLNTDLGFYSLDCS